MYIATPINIKEISAFFNKATDCLKSIFLTHKYIKRILTKKPTIIFKICFLIFLSFSNLKFYLTLVHNNS